MTILLPKGPVAFYVYAILSLVTSHLLGEKVHSWILSAFPALVENRSILILILVLLIVVFAIILYATKPEENKSLWLIIGIPTLLIVHCLAMEIHILCHNLSGWVLIPVAAVGLIIAILGLETAKAANTTAGTRKD